MNQVRTHAIILSRTDYGEADRILTLLTPDHGKVRAIAKAVRKSTSKLAGGIELFSVSDICFVAGRGELKTITSTRLIKHFGNIVKDINRTHTAYDLIKQLDKATEDNTEPGYFHALEQALAALDDININYELTRLWFEMQLLKLAGHAPNLTSDSEGVKLDASKTYDFDFSEMAFVQPHQRQGSFGCDHIKFLRLGFSAASPGLLQRVKDTDNLNGLSANLISNLLKSQIAA